MLSRRGFVAGVASLALACAVPRSSSALIGLATSAVAASAGQTFNYYIAASGCSDSNAGTVASPWCITSLQDSSSNQSLMAQKRVGLLPGTYSITIQSGNNPNNYEYPILNLPAGTSGTPTYLGSSDSGGHYSARTATLSVTSANTTTNFLIGQDQGGNGDYTIDGIVIDGGSGGSGSTLGFSPALITIVPGSSAGTITIENSEFRNCSPDLSGGNNWGAIYLNNTGGGYPVATVIQNNYFHDLYPYNNLSPGLSSAIRTEGATGMIVQFNTFLNNEIHIDGKSDVAGSQVRDNYFGAQSYGIAIRGFDGFSLGQTATANAFYNNVFDGAGQVFGQDVNSSVQMSLQFYNNTIYDSRTASSTITVDFRVTGTGNTLTSYNNILVAKAASGYSTGLYATDGAYSVEDYNAFAYNSTTAGWGNNSTTYNSLAAWQGSSGSPDPHSQAGGATLPSFASSIVVGNGPTQYQLGSGSPCLNAGKTGGTSGGSTVNQGAWDGIVTQIGANWVSYPGS